ncbi:Sarcosine dehydrogenase [hydrothermal vent metagenome]|uniref:Sarcosine dehydrogenase n=1 Tax=hydrothermal vent metagenome TaxID=652676 RepID=A0A3B0RLQ5_9ZZZZ
MTEMTRETTNALPDRTQVLIVGGGIVGCSVAYHLARRGVTDVTMLEQGALTGGTTWHAAGLVSQLKSSHSLTRLATYSARLYEELEDETGQATGYRTPGSISVAADAERWEEILRGASMAKASGVETEIIDMDQLREMWPLINTDDLVGALYIPRDGVTSPVDTTLALARGARNRGVRIIEGVSVLDVRSENGRVVGVETERGYVEAETVVLASGMWTRQLAAKMGVNVPLQACEHFYIVTEQIDGVERGMPTVRDPGGYTYFKEETGKIMAGFFEPRAKIWNLDGVPREFSFGTLPEDWEHIGPIFERAIHRVPVLGEAGIQLFFNGPEAFTPDGVYYLGEAPEVDGCFVAAGFNSVGLQSAGGVGWVIADWIVDGHPPMDLASVDIRRVFPFQGKVEYLEERISESLGLLYAMHWPFRQYESARDQRVSPIHDQIDAAGAVFGEVAGWERPNWFALDGQERAYEYSYGKQNWFEAAGLECDAVRNHVGFFDQTCFVKLTVSGPDALGALNEICANDVDVPPGKVVYTQWCNERGGIEADLTVTRIDENDFLIVTAAASGTRDTAWLRRGCRGLDVHIEDVTTGLAMFGVMGPRSRAMLGELTSADMGNEAFPFGTAQRLELAGHDVRALRMTYVGELGWELYVPWHEAPLLYEAIFEAGEGHGLRHAGYHAMNTLRLESGYRHWGHDITDQDTPLEAGLSFAVAWDKPSFTGRDALVAQRELPRTKRLVQFRLEDEDRLVYHDEPILREGRIVGRTSSGMWSYVENRCLAMGYLEYEGGVTEDWVDAGEFEMEVATERIPVTASLRSFYDPRNERVRM